MLLMTGTVIRNAPIKTNIAEKVQKGFEDVTLAGGNKRRDPLYTGKYVEGNPFSYAIDVKTPVALEVDDEVFVDQESNQVYKVLRAGNVVWKNDVLIAEESKRNAERRNRWVK